MESAARETTGSLCRWALEALAWAGACAAAYCGCLAASAEHESSRVIVSDGVFPVGAPNLEVFARLVPPPKVYQDAELLLCYGDQMASAAYDTREPYYPSLRQGTAETLRLRVMGAPYVFLTSGGDDAVVRLRSKDERLFLVDSSLADEAMQRSPPAWRRALETMAKRGIVAILHAGPAEEYAAFRAAARRDGFDVPVLCAFSDRNGLVSSLWRAGWVQGGAGWKPRQADLLTASGAFAETAAAMGFREHWIRFDGTGPSREFPRVRAYQGLEGFIGDLSRE